MISFKIFNYFFENVYSSFNYQSIIWPQPGGGMGALVKKQPDHWSGCY